MADRRRSAGSAPQRGGVRVDVILYSALSRNATFFAEKQERIYLDPRFDTDKRKNRRGYCDFAKNLRRENGGHRGAHGQSGEDGTGATRYREKTGKRREKEIKNLHLERRKRG